MLSAAQISLVQNSFRQVMPIADQASELFYRRLFELDPSLRPMFPDQMAKQRHTLVVTLSVLIGSLAYIDGLVPTIEEMGRRYAAYGVEPSHVETARLALLSTLESGLGDAFTPELRAAWTAVYNLLAEVMKRGMTEGRLAVAA